MFADGHPPSHRPLHEITVATHVLPVFTCGPTATWGSSVRLMSCKRRHSGPVCSSRNLQTCPGRMPHSPNTLPVTHMCAVLAAIQPREDARFRRPRGLHALRGAAAFLECPLDFPQRPRKTRLKQNKMAHKSLLCM